jgi:hypothetical protein
MNKRAEKKSLLFVMTLLVLAVIGATMSSSEYKFGQEAVGSAVKNVEINPGLLGIIASTLALVALVAVGYVGIAHAHMKTSKNPKSAFPDIGKIDKEINLLYNKLESLK